MPISTEVSQAAGPFRRDFTSGYQYSRMNVRIVHPVQQQKYHCSLPWKVRRFHSSWCGKIRSSPHHWHGYQCNLLLVPSPRYFYIYIITEHTPQCKQRPEAIATHGEVCINFSFSEPFLLYIWTSVIFGPSSSPWYSEVHGIQTGIFKSWFF